MCFKSLLNTYEGDISQLRDSRMSVIDYFWELKQINLTLSSCNLDPTSSMLEKIYIYSEETSNPLQI